MLIRRKAGIFVAFFALGACAKANREDPAPSRPEPAAAVTHATAKAAASPAPPSEPVPAMTISVLTYEKGAADECIDLRLFTASGDAGQKRVDGLKQMADNVVKKGGSVLKKSCREQLADRVPLASCTVRSLTEGDAGGEYARLEAVSTYYSIVTLDASDEYMKNCIELKGDWSALPKDSHEFRRARAEQTLKKANEMLDKAQGN